MINGDLESLKQTTNICTVLARPPKTTFKLKKLRLKIIRDDVYIIGITRRNIIVITNLFEVSSLFSMWNGRGSIRNFE